MSTVMPNVDLHGIFYSELESSVEELRSNVINRRCRVNMTEVENMALILSKASKMVADLKGERGSTFTYSKIALKIINNMF